MRKLTIVGAALTMALAFALYWIKYDTRRLQARMQAQERAIERAESDIAVLRAERSYLARPERLEAAARGKLGLAPAEAGQLVGIEELARRLAASAPVPAPIAGRAPGADQPGVRPGDHP